MDVQNLLLNIISSYLLVCSLNTALVNSVKYRTPTRTCVQRGNGTGIFSNQRRPGSEARQIGNTSATRQSALPPSARSDRRVSRTHSNIPIQSANWRTFVTRAVFLNINHQQTPVVTSDSHERSALHLRSVGVLCNTQTKVWLKNTLIHVSICLGKKLFQWCWDYWN